MQKLTPRSKSFLSGAVSDLPTVDIPAFQRARKVHHRIQRSSLQTRCLLVIQQGCFRFKVSNQ